MKPPICRLCGRDFRHEGPDDGGDLLAFARDEGDDLPEGPGHPPHMAWFCADHVVAARELTDATLSDAVAQLKIDRQEN
ncbi:hypothetical protein [Haloarchaeobius sp. DT45]|uniref:hypothetical protein n=1 Tax=Haloarchaeobius sp. DT45 TaxID=3446116 RepID=UPI003F6A96BE